MSRTIRRCLPIVLVVVAALSASGWADLVLPASGWSGQWVGELAFQHGDVNPFKSLDNTLSMDYTYGTWTAGSFSEFRLFGFIWQELSLVGSLGAFGMRGNLLFGPSTAEYLYGQGIASLSVAGLDVELYAAQLTDAVLQGAADGVAVRLAGSMGNLRMESITEFGAQIEDPDDDDFNGITIYHASTGLHRHYVTSLLVDVQTGSCAQGFTGQKVTVSGWSFGCVEDITSTLYLTCEGFDTFAVELDGMELGWAGLAFDVELEFSTRTKALALTPVLNLSDSGCITVYGEVLTDAPYDPETGNTIFDVYNSLTGIGLYGLAMEYSWNGITFRDLTVLHTGRYAITTEAYGSRIEEKVNAQQHGHTYYADYWELLSLEISLDGCCGGVGSLLVNTYFDASASNLFGWGMTHVEARFPISSSIAVTGEIEVDDDVIGLEHVGLGAQLSW